jgi:hypothetical protein
MLLFLQKIWSQFHPVVMLAKVNCSTADFLLASDLANSCSNYAWLLPFWLTDSYGGFFFCLLKELFQEV